jgi:hypothetical protein
MSNAKGFASAALRNFFILFIDWLYDKNNQREWDCEMGDKLVRVSKSLNKGS